MSVTGEFYKNLIQIASMGYAYHKIILNSESLPCDYEFLEVNNAFEELTGLKASEVIGERVTKVLPGIQGEGFNWIEAYGDIAINGGSREIEQFVPPLGIWYKVKVISPQKGYFVTWFTEVSKERLIARISEEFLQLRDDIDYQRITDYILGISEAQYALFNLYDKEGNCYETKAISCLKDDIDLITFMLGFNIVDKKWMNNDDYGEKLGEGILSRFPSLSDFLVNVIPESTASTLKENLQVSEVVTIKIIIEDMMIGHFTLIMPADKKLKSESIVLLYTRQVGLLITRNKAQKEMKIAHSKLLESSSILQKVEEIAHIGSWVWDFINKKMIWSDEFYRICGFIPNSVTPDVKMILSVTHPEDRSKMKKVIFEALNNGSSYELENRFIRPDGKMRWVLSKGFVERDDQNKPTKIVGSILDITSSKLMEKALVKEKERLRITLLSVGDGVITVDNKGFIDMMNEEAQRLTGWSHEEATGKAFVEVFNIIHEVNGEKYENPVTSVLETGNIIGLTNHLLLIAKDGLKTPVAYSAAPIKDRAGIVTGVVLVLRDVTEEKESRKEILYLSFHDKLTGLYNRSYFEEELKRLDIKRNLPLAIIVSDVNGLKLTNDALGHAMGDKLLKKAAEVIKGECRADDIMARLGGDEFVIILPRTGEGEVEGIVRRMRTAISNAKVDTVVLSVSIGWDVKRNINQDIHMVIKKADDYMYRRKLLESPSMRGKTLHTMISTLHEKNSREKHHSERVSKLCESIGKAMGLADENIDELRTVGLMHDIGKIAIDEYILNKSEELTIQERKEIERHPEIGYRILSAVNTMSDMAEYVLAHHERWDGNGYPKRLKKEEIPLAARIIAVADAYDAMISERSYRRSVDEQTAIKELKDCAGLQFDPNIVSIFLHDVLKVSEESKLIMAE